MRLQFSLATIYVNPPKREIIPLDSEPETSEQIETALAIVPGRVMPVRHALPVLDKGCAIILTEPVTGKSADIREHAVHSLVRHFDVAVITCGKGGFSLYNPPDVTGMARTLKQMAWDHQHGGRATTIYRRTKDLKKDLGVLIKATGTRDFVLTPHEPHIVMSSRPPQR